MKDRAGEKTMKKGLAFILTGLISLGMLSNVWAANWNSGTRNTRTPQQQENINAFIPAEIKSKFQDLSVGQREASCKNPERVKYENHVKELLSQTPPKKPIGLNSRMDNARSIKAYNDIKLFRDAITILNTEAVFLDDGEAKELILSGLDHWAKDQALLDTFDCKNNRCKHAWQSKDGQDLAPILDHTTVETLVNELRYAYHASVVAFKPEDQRHKTIQSWFKKWQSRTRGVGKNSQGIGLGYGRRLPQLYNALLDGKFDCSESNCAKSIAREILVLIDRAVNEDGSIKFHTERGDRALYYHSSGLGYATVGLEIAKFFELEIPKDLDTRIERAGEVFYSGLNDHAYMDKWAKNANRGRATKGKQFFNDDLSFVHTNGSWYFIFALRYPNSSIAKNLDKLIKPQSKAQLMDVRWGVGLGCVYRAVANKDVIQTNFAQSESQPRTPLKELAIDNQGESKPYQCGFVVSKFGTDEKGNAYSYQMASGKLTIKDDSINFGPAMWSSGKGDPNLFTQQSSLSVKNGSQLDGEIEIYGTKKATKVLKLFTSNGYEPRTQENQEFGIQGAHTFNVGRSKWLWEISGCKHG